MVWPVHTSYSLLLYRLTCMHSFVEQLQVVLKLPGVESIHVLTVTVGSFAVWLIVCAGRLVEAYDELGNRYILPKYCISRPTNMVGANSSPQRQNGANQGAENEDSQEADSMTNLLQDNASSSPTTIAAVPSSRSKASAQNRNKEKSKKKPPKSKSSRHSSGNGHSSASSASIPPSGDPIVVKVRLSTMSKDIKMTLQASDRVIDVKSRLETEHEVPASRITMLYSGRVLSDRTYIKNLDVPKGFIIQAIVTSC